MTVLVESIPKLHRLPVSLPRENAVEIEIEAGVLVFRVSQTAQNKIEECLEMPSRRTISFCVQMSFFKA